MSAVLAIAAVPAAAADMLLLQQTVLPEEAASVVLMVDRERVAVARLLQRPKSTYLVEITLIGESNIQLGVTCQNVASARQVLDALRARGIPTLDVSGRCWF